MPAAKLKPCPFCGAHAHAMLQRTVRVDRPDSAITRHWVQCSFCRSKGTEMFTLKDTVAFWNDRATPRRAQKRSRK